MGDDLSVTEIDGALLAFLQERLGVEVFPTQVVMVVSHLDPNGMERWSAVTAGGGPIPSAIGLLEYAKSWLVSSMYQQAEEEHDG